MRDYILLFVNGQQHRVSGPDAFLTLSDFVRLRLGMCGTKVVCAEGDCGSCSVLCGRATNYVAKPDQGSADTLDYLPIDSCIQFVFQLDGCHVVTVEGLACDGQLTGIQQAMIDCHGSQCGFCTPGFVMAMTGVLERNPAPTEHDWRHELTGNLCRCTGYSPIIAAGLAASPATTPTINSCFPPGEMIESMANHRQDEIRIDSEGSDQKRILSVPTTIEQATAFLAAHPEAKIVAGATDIGVQFNKGRCDSAVWLDLNRVTELEGVRVEQDHLIAGARATWREFEEVTRGLAPQFYEIVSVFGSPQIRNVGTIGGNIINASPIADSIPFLMVCGAELTIAGGKTKRTVNVNDFYRGYKQFDLNPGEILVSVDIPLPSKNCDLRLYKVSRRRDLDISTFTAAIRIEREGDRVAHAAIAFGAVGPVVLRLPKTEAFLIANPFTLETIQAAGEIAVGEITPISDVRGGQDYRLQLARNVLLKFFHQTNLEGAIA